MLAPIVSSGKAASLILRSWKRHSHRIPDFIVIEGALAGGHLGFKKEEVMQATYASLDTILQEVLALLPPYEEEAGRKIPVFVAGGIYTQEDIKHYQSLGAYGVQTVSYTHLDVYKRQVLVEAINVDEDVITMEANLKDDLGIDSLAAVELSLDVYKRQMYVLHPQMQ